MAKVKRVCDQCGNKFATPCKLCNHLKRKFKCKPKSIQIPVIQKGDKDQDPEAGPGPTTQAYREEYTTIQQVIDQVKKYALEKHFRSIMK